MYSNRDPAMEPGRTSNILVMHVINPRYPIDVHVIEKITRIFGKIQRAVIVRKTGVSAMVEFESIEDAKRAKQSLNGADIYSGCCTLKIEFSRVSRRLRLIALKKHFMPFY